MVPADVGDRVQVVDGTGIDFLETFTVVDLDTGVETVESGVLFLPIGSEPRTEWLAGTAACDKWGFLLTGAELAASDVSPWARLQAPLLDGLRAGPKKADGTWRGAPSRPGAG